MIIKIKNRAYPYLRKSVKWIKPKKKRLYYKIKDDNLKIIHNSGFFSNCSIALFGIIDFYNKYHRLPAYVDFSKTFNHFKDDINRDAYGEFFQFDESIEIAYTKPIAFSLLSLFDYKLEQHKALEVFIKKYFCPSKETLTIYNKIRQKYKVDFDNTLVICYRGTDKGSDTGLGTYEEFIVKTKSILAKNPNLRILVQTDQRQFLDLCLKEFKNCFYIEELPTTTTTTVMHKIVSNENKIKWSQTFLSIVFLISKCKFIVNHTGNVARWICLYRGNVNNVEQYFKPKGSEEKNCWI
jgi:hypothetical protein